MLIRLLIIYIIINIITWVMVIIPWYVFYLKSLDDKYTKIENKTVTTFIEPTVTDNIHHSEYISREDFINILSSMESYTYPDNHEKPEEKFYYHGKYLTSDEVIEKAHEILRWSINY